MTLSNPATSLSNPATYNVPMKKTSVYLEDEQAERLEELSKASGIPPSVLIRRFVELAMDAVLAQKKDFNFNVLMELDAVKRAIEKKRRE